MKSFLLVFLLTFGSICFPAQKKISDLTAITNAEVSTSDLITVVDVDGTPTKTRKMTFSELDLRWLSSPITSAIVSTGLVFDNEAYSEFQEATGNGDNYVRIKAPASLGADYVLTLPVDDGDSGECLKTDGDGEMSWGVCSASATAADITNVAAGNIAATDVQDAINELDTEKAALAGATLTGAFVPNANNTLDFGGNSLNWRIIYGRLFLGNAGTTIFGSDYETGLAAGVESGSNVGSGNTGAFTSHVGDQLSTGTGEVGLHTVRGGQIQEATNTNDGGSVLIESGSTLGSGDSGDVTVKIQTSGSGAQGDIKFIKQGDTTVVGDLWRASGTDGSGYWETPTTPTVQIFTSGSGTYTTPTSPSPIYIIVEMSGGGGGGGGSGTTNGTIGGTGGTTTFGTRNVTGGSGAQRLAGASGGGITGSGYEIISSNQGAQGSGGGVNPSTPDGTQMPGGAGGSNRFGGAGGGGSAGGGGIPAQSNTGGGGGGAGNDNVGSSQSGGGGGAGGYIKFLISSPASSYSYAVGAAGTAGTAGTSGRVAGAGGSGVIIVTEYYQ
jgi:hypothetical protein